ncbi:sugar phosphate isomerase/epimerase [bacterium]|nr:sugar phosphate isomerase/epimerase [bacterium]
MRLGRNFTNMLETTYLSESQKQDLKAGKLTVPGIDATVQGKSKADIIGQIDVIKSIGLNHIELDGGVPNPFLAMSDADVIKAKKYAQEKGVSISVHLPYTFVAQSVVTFQEEDRIAACSLMKRYIDFAQKLGARLVNMHPGSVPFYQATGKYLDLANESLRKSTIELAGYCKEKGLLMHVENNTAFDTIGVEQDDMLSLMKDVRAGGLDVKYCFDIGHWFTRALPQFGKKALADPVESIIETIPAEMLYEVHLNDFVIDGEKFKFHPPLHRQQGFLKRSNLENINKLFKKKGVEIVVVETAVRDMDDLLNGIEVLKEESAYLAEIFI